MEAQQDYVGDTPQGVGGGYILVLNHEKNCIKSHFKSIFLKLATNE